MSPKKMFLLSFLFSSLFMQGVQKPSSYYDLIKKWVYETFFKPAAKQFYKKAKTAIEPELELKKGYIVLKNGETTFKLAQKYADLSVPLSNIMQNAQEYKQDPRTIIFTETEDLLKNGYFTYDLTSNNLDDVSINFFITIAPRLEQLKTAYKNHNYPSVFDTLRTGRQELFKIVKLEDLVQINWFNFARLIDSLCIDEKLVQNFIIGILSAIIPMKIVYRLQHNGAVRSVEFNNDGSQIVTASWDHTAKVWDVVFGKLLHTLLGHNDVVWSAQFNPDGSKIITASDDGTAKVWNALSGRLLHTLQHNGTVQSAKFSPDGSQVITASGDRTAKIWDVFSGKLLHILQHNGTVQSAKFSPDGSKVVTASGNDVTVWDGSSGALLRTLRQNGGVFSAQFSPDGSQVITALSEGTAKIWDISSGRLLQTLGHKDWVWSALFSPDGFQVATASNDAAKIWDASSGGLLHTNQQNGEIFSAQFSPDGSQVLIASSDEVNIWDISSGRLLQTLKHNDTIWSVQFSPDGSQIVTGSWEGTIRLWEVSLPIPQLGIMLWLQAAKLAKQPLILEKSNKDIYEEYEKLPDSVRDYYKNEIKIEE